jgi:plastocyanin
MKLRYFPCQALRLVPWRLAGWVFVCALSGRAATTNVSVVSYTYVPVAVTINANDTVQWTWNGPNHSSTSDTGLWDSGIHSTPFSFPLTFTSAGTFPYHCTLHAGAPFNMKGSVTVLAVANVPPSVSITAPTDGATFAAPWTGAIQATASDSDGTVSKVDFFADVTLLGTVNNPPANPSFTVTNLAAGNYALKAVATDNGGAATTSASVAISVVTPVPIVVSSPQRLSASAFQFNYSANPGLSYVVLRSAALPGFAPIRTNTAAGSTVSFLDNSATGPVNFYRVRLAPNP